MKITSIVLCLLSAPVVISCSGNEDKTESVPASPQTGASAPASGIHSAPPDTHAFPDLDSMNFSRQETVKYNPLKLKEGVLLNDITEATPINMKQVKECIGYPPEAMARKAEGIVTMRVRVDWKGNYLQHEMVMSPDPALTAGVIRCLPELKFLVNAKNEQSAGWVMVPFRFRLEGK